MFAASVGDALSFGVKRLSCGGVVMGGAGGSERASQRGVKRAPGWWQRGRDLFSDLG